MAKGIVAIVGRPNVGKSTFFNKLTGERISIVDDTPGVTRDRISADVEWNGRELTLVDTGGIEPETKSGLLRQMRAQAEMAIAAADVIIFLTDLRTGVTDADREVATMLRRSKKPVLLAVNKVDTPGDLPADFYEFYSLGFGDPLPVSSIHGTGCGDVLDAVLAHLPETGEETPEEGVIRVAVIGKPNAGKSSLVNRITGKERVIVSDMPGTTRDAIDTPVENANGKYIFIDTAGIRRGAKIEDAIEKYSVLRARPPSSALTSAWSWSMRTRASPRRTSASRGWRTTRARRRLSSSINGIRSKRTTTRSGSLKRTSTPRFRI